MFSVVIPLYNKELSIKNTIQSVLDQSFRNFEVIVVNDGSTDNSVERVREIKDPRIKLVQQKNQGVSAARNRGISEAKFDWIAFLDGDDLWKPNHLDEILRMMSIFPNNLIYVTSFEYDDQRPIFKHPTNSDVFIVNNYFRDAIKERIIWTGIITVNKLCLNDVGFFNEELNRGEDLELWARLASKFNIVKSTKITATYRYDEPDSLTKTQANYRNSFFSAISLKNKSGFEREYYKSRLKYKLKHELVNLNFTTVLTILIKHNFDLFK